MYQHFDATYRITVLSFLPVFETSCHANWIHEGAVIWLFQYFVRKMTKAVLSAIVTMKEDRRNKKRGNLTSDPKVVNYLLRRYATDKVITGS